MSTTAECHKQTHQQRVQTEKNTAPDDPGLTIDQIIKQCADLHRKCRSLSSQEEKTLLIGGAAYVGKMLTFLFWNEYSTRRSQCGTSCLCANCTRYATRIQSDAEYVKTGQFDEESAKIVEKMRESLDNYTKHFRVESRSDIPSEGLQKEPQEPPAAASVDASPPHRASVEDRGSAESRSDIQAEGLQKEPQDCTISSSVDASPPDRASVEDRGSAESRSDIPAGGRHNEPQEPPVAASVDARPYHHASVEDRGSAESRSDIPAEGLQKEPQDCTISSSVDASPPDHASVEDRGSAESRSDIPAEGRHNEPQEPPAAASVDTCPPDHASVEDRGSAESRSDIAAEGRHNEPQEPPAAASVDTCPPDHASVEDRGSAESRSDIAAEVRHNEPQEPPAAARVEASRPEWWIIERMPTAGNNNRSIAAIVKTEGLFYAKPVRMRAIVYAHMVKCMHQGADVLSTAVLSVSDAADLCVQIQTLINKVTKAPIGCFSREYFLQEVYIYYIQYLLR